jgi:very-short-patch-repair endonuclease
MEARLLRILKPAPAPAVSVQHQVTVDDERFYLDFAFPEVRLGIEAQSLRWHLGEVRWKRDMQRDRKLKRIGWTLLYYPWDDIDLRPAQVLDEILAVRQNLGQSARLF